MATAEEIRRALVLVTTSAVDTASSLVTASPDATRDVLLIATPEIVSYYSDGSAALAADHYDELRDAAGAMGRFVAEPVIELREERLRRGVLWAADALTGEPDETLARARLAEVIQFETARPFRQTITTNARHDPAAVGWQRVTSGSSCKFCQLLAGRGAVYKASTARFASHAHCDCSAQPVFDSGAGPQASVLQYVASKRHRSASERQALREHLAAMP